MFTTTSAFRSVMAAAALSVISAMVFAPATARSEAAHNPRGEYARVGNWTGAPLVKRNNRNRIAKEEGRIKIIERVADRQSCQDSLFVQVHSRKCPVDSVSRQVALAVNNDQVLNPAAQKPVAARKPDNGVVKLTPPADEKVPPPQSTARLNTEEPGQVAPELNANPKLVKPKAPEENAPEPRQTLSCDKAGAIVGDFGFSAIESSDCDGQVYAFDASRDGKPFKITLNSASGELIQVRKASSEVLRHGH